jgi:hypothetical protein
MKIKSIYALIVLLFITCTKENNSTQLKTSVQNNITDPVDSLLPPLNDLGQGTFFDSVGGLYPGGVNTPSGTYADDLLTVSQGIVPIDTFGVPSNIGKQGQILFVSLGASTGANLMKALKLKTVGNPLTNPKLHLMNCNQSGRYAALNIIMQPDSPYWSHVKQVITMNRGSLRQVQVVYLETEDSTASRDFPERPNIVKNDIEVCLRVMKQKFPNLKVVYVLSRIRVFGNNEPWSREPSAYYSGWAYKWAIQDQIDGAPNMAYKGTNAVAPMLTWGFYEWAGTNPRKTDGFYWRPSESKDGLHANDAGEDSLSTRFQRFLLTDNYAKNWYAAH